MSPAADETADEIEVWWGGYSGWTMLPGFVLCGILTIVMIGSAWYLYREENIPADRARYAVYALALTMWAALLSIWGYRMATINYRLTSRRLFHMRGINPRTAAVIHVGDICRVTVEQTVLEKQLGVGRLRIESEKQKIELCGVRDPQLVAGMMEREAKRARRE